MTNTILRNDIKKVLHKEREREREREKGREREQRFPAQQTAEEKRGPGGLYTTRFLRRPFFVRAGN